ncbi:MAG: DUF1273 family protein [Clostridia bacterium]|nr:DUF1273 family protein [Clostridia bacterium]
MEVTFFGHRDAPPSIKPALEKTIRYLINSQNATVFYVGNNGNFDLFVADILHKLTSEFSQIEYYIVLAYMPQKSNMIQQVYLPHTLYPESVANGIPKFAISRRNEWMLQKSDLVVTYITHSYGGAKKYQNKALQAGKKVINIT